MEVSNKYPSLELAYQFVIPSYTNMLNRLASVEDRIQRFMIFVATLTAAIPLIAVGLNGDAKHLASYWTLLSLISFFAFVIVSIRGRSLGEVVMIDPGNLNDEWQSKSREEFYRDILSDAGKHYTRNNKLVFRKDQWANIAIGCFAVEMVFWIVWGYEVFIS